MVTWGKEKEDGWDVANAMLTKEVLNCITIGIIVDGVLGVGESENGNVVLNGDVIIVVFGDDFTSWGESGTKGVPNNWEMSLVGIHIDDESASKEEAIGDIDGNRANLVERAAHESGNDGPVISSVIDGGGTDNGNVPYRKMT